MPNTKPSDEWRTPAWLFEWASRTWGPFEIDVAASNTNNLCHIFYTKENSALTAPWRGKCWMNPPYSHGNLAAFCEKAYKETVLHRNADLVCGLIKDDRSTQWYWNFAKDKAIEIALPKRVPFLSAAGKVDTGAKFPVMIVIWYQGVRCP